MLVTRNITVSGRRTSMRLEPKMWDALEEICNRQGWPMAEVFSRIDAQRNGPGSLTTATRVFILNYFRHAATEAGHALAGHGEIHDEGTASLPPVVD